MSEPREKESAAQKLAKGFVVSPRPKTEEEPESTPGPESSE